jgi:putative ATP-dependent endonuclease of the OLD family
MVRSSSLRVSNYKCFSNTLQGFETILPMNLIIGRNNSGKSALLDLVEAAEAPIRLAAHGHLGARPMVEYGTALSEEVIRTFFPDNHSGGPIPGNHWEFGKQFIGKEVRFSIDSDGQFSFISSELPLPHSFDRETLNRLARVVGNPFTGYKVSRLAAARDIVPEVDSQDVSLAPNGAGATRMLQSFINKIGYPSDLVEHELLNQLNSIVAPDAAFSRITVQQDPSTGLWEVFLEEEEKGRIALTQSGSGIKTIVLVLCLLHLVPHLEHTKLDRYCFALEELENNLHPALQRRLLAHLQKRAQQTGATFFLTTHSSVAIDLFSPDVNAQIIHITHEKASAKAQRATTYIHSRGICSDLDVRASDLLQANGIVWVEGPSDRIYVNNWIELWSGNALREGLHYQCMFYGGRLLSHLAATAPEDEVGRAVNILRLNRNAICIIDSDRRDASDEVNDTKLRIVSEIESLGGYAWITSGREIENYIPDAVLTRMFSDSGSVELGQFESIAELIESIDEAAAKRFLKAKPAFAADIVPLLDRSILVGKLDIEEQLDRVCAAIRDWNRI